MALIENWLQRIGSWVSWWLTEGEPEESVHERIFKTFEGLSEAQANVAMSEGSRASRAAIVARDLGPTEILQTALEGEVPPSPLVGVKFIAVYEDQRGNRYSITVKVPGAWSHTVEQSFGYVSPALANFLRRYPGARLVSRTIIPPLRWPLPEQQ